MNKTTVSLSEFSRKLGEIAKIHGEDYYSVRAEIRQSETGRSLEFEGYIYGFQLRSGKSPEEVLEKFEETFKIVDVEVEL